MTNQAINTAIETARRAVANNAAWTRSVEKAAGALLNGQLIVTVLAGDNNGVVSSVRGTYTIRHGFCSCPATVGHCYHVSALRIVALADEAPVPRITRSWYGTRDRNAMIVNGWAV